ncbi:MAG: hypothetical protein ACQESR_03320 [Planctomycetota bacterium]
MLTIRAVEWGMFTNSVRRASRFRTTTIFSSFADTFSVALCGSDWSSEPNRGGLHHHAGNPLKRARETDRANGLVMHRRRVGHRLANRLGGLGAEQITTSAS